MSKDNPKKLGDEKTYTDGFKRLRGILGHFSSSLHSNSSLKPMASNGELKPNEHFEKWSGVAFFQPVIDEAYKLEAEVDKLDKNQSSTAGSSSNKRLSEEEKKLEPSEHKHIGNKACIKFMKLLNEEHKPLWKALEKEEIKWVKKDKFLLPVFELNKGIALTPGEIVALAGDFYGVPKRPISDGKGDTEQEGRFRDAYNTLVKADPEKLRQLLDEINKNDAVIKQEIKKGNRPRIALIAQGKESDKVYGTITKYTYPGAQWYNSRYADLAYYNFDHFGEDAKKTYRAGHRVAISTAIEAKKAGKEGDKIKLLAKALTQELFACHFLTDLFSAGHIRVPRRELYDQSKGGSVGGALAGYAAKQMHDEDSRNGLYVKSKKHRQPWFILGDDCYFEPENLTSRDQQCLAVSEGLLEVVRAFTLGKKETAYTALDYVPEYPTTLEKVKKYEAEIERETETIYPAPLFEVRNGKVFLRKEIDGRCGRAKCTYTSTWTNLGFYQSWIERQGENAEEPLTPSEKADLEAELQHLSTTEDTVTCKVM